MKLVRWNTLFKNQISSRQLVFYYMMFYHLCWNFDKRANLTWANLVRDVIAAPYSLAYFVPFYIFMVVRRKMGNW